MKKLLIFIVLFATVNNSYAQKNVPKKNVTNKAVKKNSTPKAVKQDSVALIDFDAISKKTWFYIIGNIVPPSASPVSGENIGSIQLRDSPSKDLINNKYQFASAKYLYYKSGALMYNCEIYGNEKESGANMAKFVSYYESGKIKRVDSCYNYNCFGLCLLENGQKEVYKPITTNPEFPGGQDSLQAFLKRNIKYPKEALEGGAEAIIDVHFEVDENGNIGNVSAVPQNSVRVPYFTKEALRVFALMPQWKPATMHDLKVKSLISIPINFSMP
jgi:hypothetical protein